MERKIGMVLFSIVFALSFFACVGGGKTPDQNTVGDPDLVLQSLKVHGQEPLDLKTPSFYFAKNKKSITESNVEAVFNYGKETNKEIKVVVEGGGSLHEGVNRLTFKVHEMKGHYKAWSLPIIVTIQEEPTLMLQSLTIFSVPAEDVDTAPKVSLPKDKTTITSGDIVATFNYGRIKDKRITVTVTGADNLQKGANTIKLSVPAKEDVYKAWGPQDVQVTILEGNATVLILKSLSIHGVDVKDLKNPSVEVENTVTVVEPDNVVAKFDYGTQQDVTIPVTVEHGEDIEAGENKITLKIAESSGEYLAWKKDVIVIKKGTPQNLTLSSLSVHKVSCRNVPLAPVCEIPQDKTSITPNDILAQFNYGDKVNKVLDVIVLNGGNLKFGENIINLKVSAKQYRYNEWTGSVKVIRKEADATLTLKSLFIHGEEVRNNKVSFAHQYKTVTATDVKATFDLDTDPVITKVIPVEVKNCPPELQVDKPTEIILHIPASKNEYKEKNITVEITRKALPAKIPSSITSFKFEGVETAVDQITDQKVFTSNVLKPTVTLETDRMFEKIESEEFEAAEYTDNRKTTATLTLKDNLKASTEKTVTIKVTTRKPNDPQEDLEKVLTFKIKLAQGTVEITKIEIGNSNITNQNETIKVSKPEDNVYVHIKKNKATGLTATLTEEDGATYQGDGSQNVYFLFKKVAFATEEKTFTVTVKSANATDATFTFKAKHGGDAPNKVVIEKVEVNDKSVTENASVEVSKPNGTQIKVYLQKEDDDMEVTVAGIKAIQPFAPGNKKIFSSTINGLENNVAKEIKIIAKAKNKADAEFKFTLTFKRPAGAKLVSRVEARGSDDSSTTWNQMKPSPSANTFGPDDVSGDNLENIRVTIEDLNGKDASKLKVEVTGSGGKQEATFTQDGNKWVAVITYGTPPSLSTSGTEFTLKLLENTVAIETYTVKIRAGSSGWEP